MYNFAPVKLHKALISLGSNRNAEASLQRMASFFCVWVRHVKHSPTLTSEAVGMKPGTPYFTNQLLELETTLNAEELNTLCKTAERLCGNTIELRNEGTIVADADLLLCGDKRYHKADWEHMHIKKLLKTLCITSAVCLSTIIATASTLFSEGTSYAAMASTWYLDNISSIVNSCPLFPQGISSPQTETQAQSDKELLTKAIDYFCSQKYHEALLIFNRLEKTHKLSARLRAYKGVCQYKEGNYPDAVTTLSGILTELEQYPPHEQAVYCYSCGESCFQQSKYTDAIPYFEKALAVSLENNKAEICYRLGFSNYMLGDELKAMKWFSSADSLYSKTHHDEITHAHQAQNKHMLNYLLVAHRASGVDGGDVVAGENENERTDNDSTNVNESPERQ